MTEAQAAVGLDRLPWLPDEPRPSARARTRDLMGWALAALLLVASASYWLGMKSVQELEPDPQSLRVPTPTTTVPLPQARPTTSAPDVQPTPMPNVEPIVAPPIPVIDEPASPMRREDAQSTKLRTSRATQEVKPSKPTTTEKTSVTTREAPKAKAPSLWPVRVMDGVSGRMVRIGTFATARQAKKGWWAVMRAYPGMQRLPALVVPVRSLRNGRVYYRLQMGTSSQAHSEVLCQRMRIIGQSCVVIGLNRANSGPRL